MRPLSAPSSLDRHQLWHWHHHRRLRLRLRHRWRWRRRVHKLLAASSRIACPLSSCPLAPLPLTPCPSCPFVLVSVARCRSLVSKTSCRLLRVPGTASVVQFGGNADIPLPLSPLLPLSLHTFRFCLLSSACCLRWPRHRSLLPRKLSAYLVLCSLRSTAYSCSLAAPLCATLADGACRYMCAACLRVFSVIDSSYGTAEIL